MNCYRHPKEETAVSCGKCDRPICTRCMIPGPAGMRCPECASLRSSSLYKIAPHRLLLTLIVGAVTGIGGALVLAEISWFVFIIGPMYGGFVAEVVLRAAGRKRGPIIEAIGVGSIIVGGVLVVVKAFLDMRALASVIPGAPELSGSLMTSAVTSTIWPLIGVGLGASACYYRLKYL
jgi:hypothetical protein